MPHTVVPSWRPAATLVLLVVAGSTSERSAHGFTEVVLESDLIRECCKARQWF